MFLFFFNLWFLRFLDVFLWTFLTFALLGVILIDLMMFCMYLVQQVLEKKWFWFFNCQMFLKKIFHDHFLPCCITDLYGLIYIFFFNFWGFLEKKCIGIFDLHSPGGEVKFLCFLYNWFIFFCYFFTSKFRFLKFLEFF